jgi:hypothetical protein
MGFLACMATQNLKLMEGKQPHAERGEPLKAIADLRPSNAAATRQANPRPAARILGDAPQHIVGKGQWTPLGMRGRVADTGMSKGGEECRELIDSAQLAQPQKFLS